MTQDAMYLQILARLEAIETKLAYLHDYVQQKEGELTLECKLPKRSGPMPIVGAVEQYVSNLNERKENGQDS